MMNKGIVETLEYILGIACKLFLAKIEGWDYFLVNAFSNEFAYNLMFHTFAYAFNAAKQSIGDHRGMGAVKDSNLTCAVFFQIVGNNNVQIGFMKGDQGQKIYFGFDNP